MRLEVGLASTANECVYPHVYLFRFADYHLCCGIGHCCFCNSWATSRGAWPVLVIILSLTITVLSTIQTFFRFSEQAAKEQAAANQYAGLLWEIRRWANTTQSRERTSVDSFVSDVISDMQETEAEYRGGGPQRRGPERSTVVPDTTPPRVTSVDPSTYALGFSPLLMSLRPSLNTWTPPPSTPPPSSLLRRIPALQWLAATF